MVVHLLLALVTFSLWQGERHYVWTDFTNTTQRSVLVKPRGEGACTKAGVAMPVRGDRDVLYPDRVVWNGSAHVLPGEAVRVVGELTAASASSAAIRTELGAAEYALEIEPRRFPAGRDRVAHLDIWQHPWAVARYHQVKPFSPEHYERMRPLWAVLADAGQKTITCTIMPRPWAHQCFDEYGTMVRHVKGNDGRWTFDYSLFDEYVAFAKSCGLGPQIHCYTLCPFRLKRYVWEDERGVRQEGDFDVGSREWLDFWTPFLEDFARHLRARGWFEDTYIGVDEQSPAQLRMAADLVKAHGGFKIQMAGNRPPSEYEGIEVDNFSIDLDDVTERYLAEAKVRRAAGKITTVYSAGNSVCTSLKHAPEKIEWLGGYAGEHDLDGYLRWAFCSWPAHPNADAQFNPWFGEWTSGGTFLYYPEGPSVRYLALLNGINRTEKLLRMRRNIK